MSDAEGFVRCSHCRGFYEVSRAKCKWCSYDTVFVGANDKPIVYADRETVRAIQIAEYHRLPKEAYADHMGPPRDHLDMLCACIHCGPGGHEFEAVEMRWIINEHMWACPCTTCGGRGFQFDIHPVEPIWECAQCHHWYTPKRFTPEYAQCPKCGCTEANGWYEDEDEDEDDDDEVEEEFEDDTDEEESEFEDDDGGAAVLEPPASEEDIPWEEEVKPWYPGKDEDDLAAEMRGESMPDDIDFPRHFPPMDERTDAEDIPF